MLFADDSLIFCQGQKEEYKSLVEVLSLYGKTSRQKVNFQKFFGKGITTERKNIILNMTRIQTTGGFGRYLGLPKMVGRIKNDTFLSSSKKL